MSDKDKIISDSNKKIEFASTATKVDKKGNKKISVTTVNEFSDTKGKKSKDRSKRKRTVY